MVTGQALMPAGWQPHALQALCRLVQLVGGVHSQESYARPGWMRLCSQQTPSKTATAHQPCVPNAMQSLNMTQVPSRVMEAVRLVLTARPGRLPLSARDMKISCAPSPHQQTPCPQRARYLQGSGSYSTIPDPRLIGPSCSGSPVSQHRSSSTPTGFDLRTHTRWALVEVLRAAVSACCKPYHIQHPPSSISPGCSNRHLDAAL